MLSVLLLACVPRTPPELFAAPVPRVELAPPDATPADPDECAEWVPATAGELAPCTGLLGPSVGPRGLVGMLDSKRREKGLGDALGVCYDGRELDRVWAGERYAEAWSAYQDAEREARLRRALGPVVYVGGVLTGVGVAVLGGWAVGQVR